MSDAKMPERVYVAWPREAGRGLAFNAPADSRTEFVRADLCASGQQVRAVSVERVEMVNYESGYEQPAEPIWRVVVGGYCADFETESAARNFAGAIAALTPAPDHRSFPDAADGRPCRPWPTS